MHYVYAFSIGECLDKRVVRHELVFIRVPLVCVSVLYELCYSYYQLSTASLTYVRYTHTSRSSFALMTLYVIV